MPNPRTQAARERARKERRQQQLILAAQRRARRKRLAVGILGVGCIVALAVGLVVAGSRGSSSTAATTTTSVPDREQVSIPDGPPADVPSVAPGATLTGDTPCPAPDGSAPRTTSFAKAPPTCIDPAKRYNAVLKTTEGDITFLLNPEQSANAVNNFVVLSRYHYWDGAPITTILPTIAFRVQDSINNPEGVSSPGYTIANDTPPQGALQTVGNPSLIVPKDDTGRVDPGQFQVALGEEAAGLPKNTPVFGLMLDDGTRDNQIGTLQRIRKAGSKTGEPTKVITINSITITEENITK